MSNIQAHVSLRFGAVRDAFAENFARRRELGGTCCAFEHGEKVVDLWGGIRNRRTREPWEQDTMVVVHSATKGLASTSTLRRRSIVTWRSPGRKTPKTS